MLIGLHFENELTNEDWSELVGSIIPYLYQPRVKSGKKQIQFPPTDIRVVNPQTLDQYIDVLKGYSTKRAFELRIVVNTHYNLITADDVAAFRLMEYRFDQRGGTIWGDKPTNVPDTPLTYAGPLNDMAMFGKVTNYRAQRGLTGPKLSSLYTGRVSVDPHTLLVGRGAPARFQSSIDLDNLVTSLPSSDGWWQGVGFLKLDKEANIRGTLNTLEHVRMVTVSDAAHDRLEDMGFEHTQFLLPDNQLVRRHGNAYLTAYGKALQNSVEAGVDNHGWTYSG